jgi:5'(3')-deoxyribonucleotidase
MTTLYLDMDGVVADFDAYALAAAGLPPSGGFYNEEQWQLIASNSRLYRDLPKTIYADTLVETCRQFCSKHNYNLLFLTAVPKGNDMHWTFYDKMLWTQQYYPDIPVHFGPYSVDKHVHCVPGDILIDDRRSNIEEWRAAGGIAIHHVSISTTLLELNSIDQSS